MFSSIKNLNPQGLLYIKRTEKSISVISCYIFYHKGKLSFGGKLESEEAVAVENAASASAMNMFRWFSVLHRAVNPDLSYFRALQNHNMSTFRTKYFRAFLIISNISNCCGCWGWFRIRKKYQKRRLRIKVLPLRGSVVALALNY